jgi:NADH:ubiquinone oxidoreductase subunit
MAARGLVARLTWALFKRETVGVDALGNRYSRALDRTPEGEVWERRTVKFSGGAYDPLSIPPPWSAWLAKTRAAPPGEEDLAADAAARGAASARAAGADARAEEESARERAQRAAERAGGGGGFAPQLKDR